MIGQELKGYSNQMNHKTSMALKNRESIVKNMRYESSKVDIVIKTATSQKHQ